MKRCVFLLLFLGLGISQTPAIINPALLRYVSRRIPQIPSISPIRIISERSTPLPYPFFSGVRPGGGYGIFSQQDIMTRIQINPQNIPMPQSNIADKTFLHEWFNVPSDKIRGENGQTGIGATTTYGERQSKGLRSGCAAEQSGRSALH